MPKNGLKNEKNMFFCSKQILKCGTCFYVHFSGAFHKSVGLDTKKLFVLF